MPLDRTCAAAASSTALCSVAQVIMWGFSSAPPRPPSSGSDSAAPRIVPMMARLSDSVAPPVNRISEGLFALTSLASSRRASSTATMASLPYELSVLEALPYASRM